MTKPVQKPSSEEEWAAGHLGLRLTAQTSRTTQVGTGAPRLKADTEASFNASLTKVARPCSAENHVA